MSLTVRRSAWRGLHSSVLVREVGVGQSVRVSIEPELGPVGTRLLLETPSFRAWAIELAPGEANGLHHHAFDHVLYTLQAATLEIANPGQPSRRVDFEPGLVSFVPAGVTESARNIGSTHFVSIDVELTEPATTLTTERAYGRSSGESRTGDEVLLETPRVRVVETCIVPGESWTRLASDCDQLVIALRQSALAVGATRRETRACDAFVDPASSTETLRNLGRTDYRELSLANCR
jgi:quercetin dioxygenase-like cupin family protein